MYGKRGQTLENTLQYTNNIYKNKGWALIDKVPTPWTVHYNKRTGKVYKAFPKEKSTVDYAGVSHGRAIAFEAKSTNVKTSFPLDNIKKHQIDYLIAHKEQGGISFFIIEFRKNNKTFFVDVAWIAEWYENSKRGGRKSIPFKWLNLHCDEIVSKNGVPLDYLSICKTFK